MTHESRRVEQGESDLVDHDAAVRVAAVANRNPIIVHSHLRWDSAWQRPQQILSRLSATRRILFVEDPMWLDDSARPSLHVGQAIPNVYRAIPRLPSSMRDGGPESDIAVRSMLKQLIGEGELAGAFHQPIQWFYTPMAAPAMLDAFRERAVVYDCMDELSESRVAPAQLVLRERYLLSRADVVFTAGRRLFEAKSRHHDDVHYFGCGVEVEHFAQAREAAAPIAREIAALPGHVLGYIGAIDERLDYELIAKLARALPHMSIAMVGPVVKGSPDELPQAPNVYWLGPRAYEDLPTIIKGFDVCLMPFALNEATEYIDPTKTLEYMAAGRPIVSTPIADVVSHFGSFVTIGADAESFIAAAARNVASPDVAQVQRATERATQSSWSHIVDEMTSHVDRVIDARSGGARIRRAAMTNATKHAAATAASEVLAAAGAVIESDAAYEDRPEKLSLKR